ncbi:hypothetical protein DSCO28_07910 [Desulfosarcina ovata subsp. sediminis]|uniref:Uncharacterized protein n=1 Tax=Desulfosarcina ovata subsp. sediminis TaxID=885957 RepID=A0A5K7ZJ41_9BACT|nr:hypothetical protein [Desulfosarcina ovata]BBO80225.1 hypothetical protein DSCO28_07910 [Desulfosarcina ovata subsp. sediminis]
MDDQLKVTCIDACMGTGKTTHAEMMFNSAPTDAKFLYITPYLKEVERIEHDCPGFVQPMTMKEANKREKETGKWPEVHPSIRNCMNKGEAIHQLISDGHNITSTHSLFKDVGEDTVELLRIQGYTLVMDEVLTPVEGLDVKAKEVKAMLDADVIRKAESLTEGGKVIKAIPGNQDGFERGYDDLRRIAKNGRLVLVDDTVLVWLLPTDLLSAFREVYLMTYMFDCQPIAAYFKMFGIEVIKKTLWCGKLVDYSEGLANGKLTGVHQKLAIHERGRVNDIGDIPSALSKEWYKRDTKVKAKQIANNLYNFFHNHTDSPLDERMWTTYKDRREAIEKAAGREASRFADGFVSNNVRATNDLDHKSALAFCCNFHMNPYIKKFFKYGGADPHEDDWALSEMLQWIWRSRIRTEKSITVYIPSKRMRSLLKDWLDKVQEWTKGAEVIPR